MSIVDRAWEQKQVVPPEIRVGLFAGYQQEITVGEALAPFQINFLFIEAKLAPIARMRVGVEVGQDGDIDAKIAEDRQPGGLEVHRPGVGELFVEVEMEMADQYFEAGHGLVHIVVR